VKKYSLKLLKIAFIVATLIMLSENTVKAGWSKMGIRLFDQNRLQGVWGSSSSDVFAVGFRPKHLRAIKRFSETLKRIQNY